MTGWGWVALGKLDTITDPTCGIDSQRIALDSPCLTATNWNAKNALCVSGSIPALSRTPTQPNYDQNWGLQVGVDSSDPEGTPIAKAFSSIVFSVTGLPATGLGAVLHRKGDPAGRIYCAALSTGVPIPFTSFTTNCGNVSGVGLELADVPNIDKIAVQVSSTTEAIVIENLCLVEIAFSSGGQQ
jgi:hypothetical protein